MELRWIGKMNELLHIKDLKPKMLVQLERLNVNITTSKMKIGGVVCVLDKPVYDSYLNRWYVWVSPPGMEYAQFILYQLSSEEGIVRKVKKAPQTNLKKFIGSVLPAMTSFTGTDPEIFVQNSKGFVLPAWEFAPKKPPEARHGQAFWDGFQAEFTVLPSGCHAYLVDRIQEGLLNVCRKAQKIDPGAKLNPSDVVDVSPITLATAKKEYIELGCMPSKNIYGENPINVEGRTLTWRTAGFHVHHEKTKFPQGSFYQTSSAPPEKVIEICDAFCGVVMTAVLQGLEDSRRRMLYGRAGEYRLPSYGYEYRTIGSTVLWHPAITHLALDLCRTAFQLGERGLNHLWEYTPQEVERVINEMDVKGAKKIVKKNLSVLKGWFKKKYGETTKALKIVNEGAAEFIELDAQKNWKIDTQEMWKVHSGGANDCFASFSRGVK